MLELRPEAKPNRLVLAPGLALFMGRDEALRAADLAVTEPRLARNRFRELAGQ